MLVHGSNEAILARKEPPIVSMVSLSKYEVSKLNDLASPIIVFGA